MVVYSHKNRVKTRWRLPDKDYFGKLPYNRMVIILFYFFNKDSQRIQTKVSVIWIQIIHFTHHFKCQRRSPFITINKWVVFDEEVQIRNNLCFIGII